MIQNPYGYFHKKQKITWIFSQKFCVFGKSSYLCKRKTEY